MLLLAADDDVDLALVLLQVDSLLQTDEKIRILLPGPVMIALMPFTLGSDTADATLECISNAWGWGEVWCAPEEHS